MDEAADKKRKQNRDRVQRFFIKHAEEVVRMSMVWPRDFLKKVDEAAAAAGISRRAWVLDACGKELKRRAVKVKVKVKVK